MLEQPKVSVLIPAYNVDKWISESISSIINQSYKNIEIVIVDDCSTDNTYRLIKEFADKDSRIIALRNSENKKIVETLNHGLAYCTGEYILRHDADDVSELNRICAQIDYLIERDLDLVGTQMTPIDQDGKVIGAQSSLPLEHELISRIAEISSPLTHIWICKIQVYKELGGYRKVPYAEDYDFLLRAIDHGFKCGNTPVALTRIRHREGNTNDVASLPQRRGHFYALKMHNERVLKGVDSYSELDANKLLKCNVMISSFHKISTNFLQKAYKSKSGMATLLFTALSAATSYYNCNYIYQRIRVKMMMKRKAYKNGH